MRTLTYISYIFRCILMYIYVYLTAAPPPVPLSLSRIVIRLRLCLVYCCEKALQILSIKKEKKYTQYNCQVALDSVPRSLNKR